MEGHIASIKEKADLGSTVITLEHGEWIYLNQIIAVNGQFRSDYSEC
jgi:hypothetical protein